MLHTTQQCCPHLCLWQDLSLLHFLSHRNTRSENKPHSQCKYIWFLIYSTTICSNLCLIIISFYSILFTFLFWIILSFIGAICYWSLVLCIQQNYVLKYYKSYKLNIFIKFYFSTLICYWSLALLYVHQKYPLLQAYS